ncbi:hypothetical protein N7539_009520 [Penicillium diatomitis]|uniref:HNH nuclease domain-containing protein n=1 Tax=Penicillium diatomitis TaxID=2819901 RepID=A0A9W9WK69_9EURO|nr:uncharacterized protein N7539_009520 [Penicillium diatomitis]KAJ5466564.1 hypothetical protein N7539_009520 [Penicillium diatomitis]
MDTVHVFSEFEDPERQDLIGRLLELDDTLSSVARTSLFALWFSDMSVLRRAVEPDAEEFRWALRLAMDITSDHAGIWAGNKISAKNEPRDNIRLENGKLRRLHPEDAAYSTQAIEGPVMLGACIQRSERVRSRLLVPSTLSARPQPPARPQTPRRSNDIKNLVLTRDRERYVLTKLVQPTLDVSHIIPFKLNGVIYRNDPLWRWLRVFWGEERTRLWQQELFQSERDTLKTDPREGEGVTDIGLFHYPSGTRIGSGFVFELSTPNAETIPLPSFSLLELRWYLSRIMAMQGAAEEEDDNVQSDPETPQVHSQSEIAAVWSEDEDDG